MLSTYSFHFRSSYCFPHLGQSLLLLQINFSYFFSLLGDFQVDSRYFQMSKLNWEFSFLNFDISFIQNNHKLPEMQHQHHFFPHKEQNYGITERICFKYPYCFLQQDSLLSYIEKDCLGKLQKNMEEKLQKVSPNIHKHHYCSSATSIRVTFSFWAISRCF